MNNDEPLWRGVHGALLFAFNFAHGQSKKSALATMMGGNTYRQGRGLSGMDGAGQAGMIRGEVERMDVGQKNVLVCRFAPSSMPCACRAPCCRGTRQSKEWSAAIEWLTMNAAKEAIAGKRFNYRLVRGIVERHFGVSTSFIQMSEFARVDRDTASAHNREIVHCLKVLEDQAMAEVTNRLKDANIIE